MFTIIVILGSPLNDASHLSHPNSRAAPERGNRRRAHRREGADKEHRKPRRVRVRARDHHDGDKRERKGADKHGQAAAAAVKQPALRGRHGDREQIEQADRDARRGRFADGVARGNEASDITDGRIQSGKRDKDLHHEKAERVRLQLQLAPDGQ